MKEIKLYKKFLIVATALILLFLIYLTADVIGETKNWKYFDIDFENKNNIVSGYGTLIGGILSFLSILFVLFGLLEQRLQILKEKKDKI